MFETINIRSARRESRSGEQLYAGTFINRFSQSAA